jgi:hypothetical protein
MTSAALELQRAVFAALQGNAELDAAMATVRLYDQAPANAKFPYLTFGRTSVYDWSTDTETGAEHLVTLHVWSKARGKSECHALIETVRAALDDASLALDGHALIKLRMEYSEVRYEDDNDVHHGLIRFLALTEAAT